MLPANGKGRCRKTLTFPTRFHHPPHHPSHPHPPSSPRLRLRTRRTPQPPPLRPHSRPLSIFTKPAPAPNSASLLPLPYSLFPRTTKPPRRPPRPGPAAAGVEAPSPLSRRVDLEPTRVGRDASEIARQPSPGVARKATDPRRKVASTRSHRLGTDTQPPRPRRAGPQAAPRLHDSSVLITVTNLLGKLRSSLIVRILAPASAPTPRSLPPPKTEPPVPRPPQTLDDATTPRAAAPTDMAVRPEVAKDVPDVEGHTWRVPHAWCGRRPVEAQGEALRPPRLVLAATGAYAGDGAPARAHPAPARGPCRDAHRALRRRAPRTGTGIGRPSYRRIPPGPPAAPRGRAPPAPPPPPHHYVPPPQQPLRLRVVLT